MSDLRDDIHKTATQTADEKLFLEYHENSHVAFQRVEAKQVRLTPEARSYMREEIERRSRIKAELKAKDKEENDCLNAADKPAVQSPTFTEPTPGPVSSDAVE